MKFKYIICTVCLLVAGIGHASAGSGEKPRTESRAKVRESSAVQLLAGKKRDIDGRVSMRCAVVRCDTAFVLQARILKGDFAVQVVRPGLRLVLQSGESVMLEPERKSACCGDWAAGRWNNVSFQLSESDIELLKKYDIVSIVITTGKEENIERNITFGKQGAISKLIRSIE